MAEGVRSIYLVRHGRPAVRREGWCTARGFDTWWHAYEASGLEPDGAPPQDLVKVAATCDTIFASPIPRARETAEAIAGGKDIIIDPVFVEAPLPAPPIPFVPLPVSAWWAIARFHWWLNFRGTYEKRSDVTLRADEAGARLLSAAETGDVLLCGHGWFNRMVSKRLQRAGFALVRDGGDAYWGWRRYERAL